VTTEAFIYRTFCPPAITSVFPDRRSHDANSLLHRARMLTKLAPVIMIESEVYAAGVRAPAKILELDRQIEAVRGLRHKVEGSDFLKLGLASRFAGAIPPEFRPRSKTRPLSA
jgi:hypothetical protein